jgi:hypothetical protein
MILCKPKASRACSMLQYCVCSYLKKYYTSIPLHHVHALILMAYCGRCLASDCRCHGEGLCAARYAAPCFRCGAPYVHGALGGLCAFAPAHAGWLAVEAAGACAYALDNGCHRERVLGVHVTCTLPELSYTKTQEPQKPESISLKTPWFIFCKKNAPLPLFPRTLSIPARPR